MLTLCPVSVQLKVLVGIPLTLVELRANIGTEKVLPVWMLRGKVRYDFVVVAEDLPLCQLMEPLIE
jgi:hypothetical protein